MTDTGDLYDVMSPTVAREFGEKDNGRVKVVKRATAKLRDGSHIKEVHRMWSTGYASIRLNVIEATTSSG